MRNFIWDIYLKSFIGLLVFLRFFYWTEKIDRRKLNARDRLIIDEAIRRGYKLENLKRKNYQTRFYRASKIGQTYLFETMPLGKSFAQFAHEDLANKWFVKKILQKAKIPTPVGEKIKSFQEALRFIEKHQYPVVIKPLSESRCQGVTVNIDNQQKLIRAIKDVQIFGRHFLIEKFVEGPSYRIMVVDGRVVAACLRKPPQVIGDGRQSLRELVAAKNSDSRRGLSAGCTLHPLKIGKNDGRSVPEKNQIVVLSSKINLGSGADTIDLTGKIHRQAEELAIETAKILGTSVLGLDFITPEIDAPRTENNPYWIIEINTLPFIDMHHFPYEGQPRDVAGAIWDMALRDQK